MQDDIYDRDSLRTNHNHDFMDDPAFRAAYARGVKATGMDYSWEWRVHTGLWVASCANKLEGDFMNAVSPRVFSVPRSCST